LLLSNYDIWWGQSNFSNEEKLQDATSDESTEEFTGDGTVDRKGNMANRQRTGGWRAAPLIFGTYVTSCNSNLHSGTLRM
jgi:hypothetical protein